jgi:hypothetical protein
MRKSVEIDVFGIMIGALRPTYLDGTMDHLSPAARGRVKRTVAFHALAKKLREAGAPEIKLSVFEVDDDSFNAALAAAGVGWQSDDRKILVTFFWEDSA